MANYNEIFLGDLSDEYNNPTNHEFFPGQLVLFTGSNTVTGSTVVDDRDFFTFKVPDGFTVSEIVLNNYQWGNGNQSTSVYGRSYFAITQGSSFPSFSEVKTFNDSTFEVSKLIDNSVEKGSELGKNLLKSEIGTPAFPASPTGKGQLGPGIYSVWYQETGANTTYEFNIVLNAPADANFGEIQFSSSNFQVNEAAGTVDIALTRTGGSDGAVSVELHRTGGSAENLVDFSFHPVIAIFKAGETQQVFSYPIVNDDLIEGNETVTFELTNPSGGVSLGTSRTSTLTIIDDDQPTINLSASQTIVEGKTNPQKVTYTVSLSKTSTQTITVHYATADCAGKAGVDYTSTAGTLTFNPGDISQVINIPILNDSLNEANETFTLTLTCPTNASLGTTKTVTTTITDTLTACVTTTLPTNVENLTLTGTGAINGTGNAGNNILKGNSANNVLKGNAGNDRLVGGLGNDILVGGLGTDTLTGGVGCSNNDKFVFDTGAAFNTATIGKDIITDFTHGVDKIVLDKTTFTALSSLSFASVSSLAQAQTSSAQITYIRSLGNLFYNQNGATSGFGTGGQFADLTNGLLITASDFLIQA